MWCVYILECNDGTYYTGITNDLTKRIAKHNTGKGAKYTSMRRPVIIRAVFDAKDRSEASKEEYRIKRLTRQEKIVLINKQNF